MSIHFSALGHGYAVAYHEGWTISSAAAGREIVILVIACFNETPGARQQIIIFPLTVFMWQLVPQTLNETEERCSTGVTGTDSEGQVPEFPYHNVTKWR